MFRYTVLFLLLAPTIGCNSGKPVSTGLPVNNTVVQSNVAQNPTSKEPEIERVRLTTRAVEKLKKIQKKEQVDMYLRVSIVGEEIKLDLDTLLVSDVRNVSESRGFPISIEENAAKLLPVGIVVDFDEEENGFKIGSPGSDQASPETSESLAEARRNFKSALRSHPAGHEKTAPLTPPAALFKVVNYEAPLGKLAAYLTPDPRDGKKHPAIIWITGGDCNTIDAGCWNDEGILGGQSASEYRKAGLIMMFPSLRGGNNNPGAREGFLGEVDDVIAAARFLRKQPYVDPDRIYLGGHSTGGTMALLTAECSDTFRAVFPFGPSDDVLGYGLGANPFSLAAPNELRLRSPGQWLHSIRTPVFVFEGSSGGNAASLRLMSKRSKNPNVHFFVVSGANHFNLLSPINRLIANRILKDTGPQCNIQFTDDEISKSFRE